MEKNLQDIVISSKKIMVSSLKQLLELKKQPHPNEELIRVVQENYNTAKKTVEIVSGIEQTDSTELEETASVAKENVSQAKAPTSPASHQNIQMTREQYRQSHES
ncbi:hypothetical protein [Limosilactobacillus fastidiosus]|uniref:Uncharacterized protein n=1 Tax=Limosilactobacillus fastidiosus TaxID=2759855 RepID=A0A7W3TZQ8_9LACO|nr:hypothetical protein [Limosilactobacillus fastidiosus]MBB1063304.1 hypothetical protein [Limosilactobacillus fastidiosus]MBB1086278.1 hypothetical protein [Limosilactobacillus fastidiosus]MCD7084526.1 hypothetical protein [Limosilactobacillus fastidiosus]MCD7086382.1 hypothetical protein [Limosilactobacillus fastidiosus]MCD7114262.1 hypothetical protein [Limosilactobacillus fastidiosus]